MLRSTDSKKPSRKAASERFSEAEKWFLAVAVFLVIKGILNPADASDRAKVRSAYDRLKQGKLPPELTNDLDLW